MSDSTTDQVKPESSISGKAWLYIVGALGLGLLAGLKLGTTQVEGWKSLANDWKTLSEEQSATNAANTDRWQSVANKSSAITERCFALVDQLQGNVQSTDQP